MPEKDPLETLRKLGQKVEETFAQMGMKLELFAPIPSLHPEFGEPDHVQCIFTVDLEELGKTEEERETEEERQRTNVEFARMREEARVAEIREQLAARMQTGANIFDALQGSEQAQAEAAAQKPLEAGDDCPNCGDGHPLVAAGLAIVCENCDWFRAQEAT